METKSENKKQQWRKNSISSASSSSRCSSIASDSSDGHFDIKLFPLPKPTLSASEAQKQREFHHMYNSSGSSWSSICYNNVVDFLPGYDPNRIPSSVFSSNPANSTEWSIASNESLFSIHDANFINLAKEDHGLAPGMRLSEIPRIEEMVNEITEINPVPLPPVKKPNESKRETITEEEPSQVEKSDSEIDDQEEEMTDLQSKDDHEEEMTELESKDDHEEEKQNTIKAKVLIETEAENPKAKEKKPRDSSSTVSHSPSVSCRSNNSNNSIGSFAFPLLQKDDAEIQTPSMIMSVSHKQKPSYQLPQSPRQTPQPQTPSSKPNEIQPQSQPQRKASKLFKSQTLSLKISRTRWFSCFYCPSNCGSFK